MHKTTHWSQCDFRGSWKAEYLLPVTLGSTELPLLLLLLLILPLEVQLSTGSTGSLVDWWDVEIGHPVLQSIGDW